MYVGTRFVVPSSVVLWAGRGGELHGAFCGILPVVAATGETLEGAWPW